ncbi:hypothetical protein ACLMJK_005594 [Lecanora helva]
MAVAENPRPASLKYPSTAATDPPLLASPTHEATSLAENLERSSLDAPTSLPTRSSDTDAKFDNVDLDEKLPHLSVTAKDDGIDNPTLFSSSLNSKAPRSQRKVNAVLQFFRTSPEDRNPSQAYLLGIRGALTISSFLYTFLLVFAPVTVKGAPGTDNKIGPLYERIIRQTLSVLFWNQSLIYSGFILLSARTICLPFLANPGKVAVASAVFRRGLRLWFPVAVALAFAKIISSTTAKWAYMADFKGHTANESISVPYTLPTTLAYFNSVFNVFWITRRFSEQAGSTGFPGQNLWSLSAIYSQSYTIYMTMVIIPYTRPVWRVRVYIGFVLTAWWCQSWAWYSITGLAIADAVCNMEFREKCKKGVSLPFGLQWRCPVWLLGGILIVAGGVMQYLWTAWRPEYENKELVAHTGLYYSGGLNTTIDENEPQARDDSYLLLLGLGLVIESVAWVRRVLEIRVLRYIGRRSLSFFLAQSIIIYTIGIKLFMHLSIDRGVATVPTRIICLLVSAITTLLGGEVFYRLIDYPSNVFAKRMFDWIRE